MQLSISLLGYFSAALDEQEIPASRTKKIEALLAFLVVEADRPHRRENLMGLLFPDMPDDVASTNLRQTLTRLRSAIQDADASPPFLTITRESIQFNRQSDHWCDFLAFNALLAGCTEHPTRRIESCVYCMARMREALAFYRGPLLADFFLADSAAFEDWAATYREHVQRQAMAALDDLTAFYTRRGEFAQAIVYGRRQVELEPWLEETHQLLMRLLARVGRRTEAMAQYKRCVDALYSELGVEPAASTISLRDQIAVLGDIRPHNLPILDEIFVGRGDELAQIYACFSGTNARLVTLVGAGGIGKTRLALEAAWRIAHEYLGPFMHGVYFVALVDSAASFDGEQALAIAIADALRILPVGAKSPLDVVLGYIQNKELLLIVDNCEEVGGAITLLATLLNHAPGLQILVTSREPIDLANEFLLRIDGLPFPRASSHPSSTDTGVDSQGETQDDGLMLDKYQSVQLFAHHANRVGAAFSWKRVDAAEQQAVARICQLCEGMPLALEMAAVWVSMLSCQEIAAEIARNFDILQSSQRQRPSRHHSIRAVFDYSWARLTEAERTVLAQLSVFRGGFDRVATQAITTATLPILASLVRKSLVRMVKIRQPTQETQTEQVRYALHPLLRQYAAEKLAADPAQAEHVQEQHSRYYCAWLHQRTPELKGSAQQQAIAAIARDFDNVRQAWQGAAVNQWGELLDQAVDGFTDFCELRGLFAEGEGLLAQAVDHLQSAQRTTEDDVDAIVVAKMLARQGWLRFLLGHSAQAQKQLEEAVGILRVLEVETELVIPLNYLAYVAYCTDQYELGLKLSGEASEIAQQIGDKLGLANAWRTSAAITEVKGELSQSIQRYEQALSVYRQIDNGQGACWSLLSLSSCATTLGDYETAITRAQDVIALAQQIGFQLVEGWAFYGLGRIYIQRRNYSMGAENLEHALQIGRRIHDRRQQGNVLNALGTCMLCLGDLERAKSYFEQALAIYRDVNNVLKEGIVLNDLGIVARYMDDYATSYELSRRALEIGQKIANHELQRRAFTNLGHVYCDQERFILAQNAYEQALENTEGMQLKMHPLSGLALVAINRDDQELAQQLMEAVVAILATNEVDGSDEPNRLRRTIHQVIAGLCDPRADALLKNMNLWESGPEYA